LRYLWDFGDGTQGEGVTSVHRYRLPGSYLTTLTVIDNAKQAGKKARKTMWVALPQPPTAVAGPGRTVASGQRIVFDGSASKSGHGAIVDYTWGFGDGVVANGRRISHVFEQPGEYLVTLRVTNDAKTRCNTSHDQVAFRVNAAPVAEAGNHIIASIGDAVTLDAGLSYDADGKLISYLWDFGDGARPKEGQVVEHVYHQPGRYQVFLTVRDDAGVANSMASDTLTAVITYPPLAQAEADRKVAIGEVIEFDGRTSKAAMGEFADYFWDFGDGAQAQGINVVYAYNPGL
jgi:PKD repeat protein